MLLAAEKAANRFAQDEWEFAQMCRYVTGSARILEIGSRYGESLRGLASAACLCPNLTYEGKSTANRIRLVGVDLGVDPFSPDGEDIAGPLTQTITDLCAQGYDARLVLGDSHDPKVVEIVRELGPYDFVFIDGDHSYDGVYQDYRNYGPMAKVVAFHDIVYGKPGHDGAKVLWQQIKQNQCRAEYVRSGLGIGVLFREEKMR